MGETVLPGASDAQRWALLIGINEYQKLPAKYNLQGCINDVTAIEELLTNPQFAFPAQNILKLTSPAADPEHLATRYNILKAFSRHLIGNERIRMGDIVVIYYSGHGSQIPDEEGDEEDGYDETIVPCDSGDRSIRHEVRDISDDEMSSMLDRLAIRTQNINLIFDSCHSGTVTRGLLDAENRDALGRERYLPAATYPITQPAKRPATRSMGPSDWMPLSNGYVLISACMAHERAREDRFSFWRKTTHGIMTYYLLEAMKEVGPQTTYFDIWDLLRVKVTKRNRRQNPQIEGAYERKVFGGAALPRKRYVEVTGKSAEGVALAAGLANGATLGSKFAIYKPNTETFDDQSGRVAVIKLARVAAFSCAGPIEAGSLNDVQVGASAIEIEHDYGDMRLVVEVIGNGSRLEAVRQGIRKSHLLSLMANANDSPTARVRLRYPLDAQGNEITSAEEKLFILSAGDGYQLVEPITFDDQSPALVKDKLESIAAFYNVLAIHNPDQQSQIKDKIKLRLLKVISRENNPNTVAPIERNSGGDVVLKVGEKVILEVDNQSNQPLHLVILTCDSSWGITPTFPEAGATDTTVPAMSIRRIDSFTVDLYDYQKPVQPNQPLLREVLKAIATTERLGFRSLWQRSTREFMPESTSLEVLLEKALGMRKEHVTRSLERDDDPAVQDWTTAELVFHITT